MPINSTTRAALLVLPLMFLAGCASLTGPARKHALSNRPYWMDYDASRRGTLVLPPPDGKGYGYCAEPSPDVTYSSVLNMVASVQLQSPSVDANTQLQFQQSVVELAQRTETIQFLREAMYRLCEQSMNWTITPDQTEKLYDSALNTALALAEADLAKNQSTLALRLADPKIKAMWDKLVAPNPQATPAAPAVPQ